MQDPQENLPSFKASEMDALFQASTEILRRWLIAPIQQNSNGVERLSLQSKGKLPVILFRETKADVTDMVPMPSLAQFVAPCLEESFMKIDAHPTFGVHQRVLDTWKAPSARQHPVPRSFTRGDQATAEAFAYEKDFGISTKICRSGIYEITFHAYGAKEKVHYLMNNAQYLSEGAEIAVRRRVKQCHLNAFEAFFGSR